MGQQSYLKYPSNQEQVLKHEIDAARNCAQYLKGKEARKVSQLYTDNFFLQ